MQESRARWVVGLRRSWVLGTALDRWTSDHGVTGVVWTPASWVADDAAPALVRIVEAGAAADAELLWDLSVPDIRAAADALKWKFRERDEFDGYVAVWIDPERMVDAPRALAAANALLAELDRENVVAAFAWTGARAGALTAIIADGLPVAVSGVKDPETVAAVRRAWVKGMDRLRKDVAAEHEEEGIAEQIADVPVFLLGSPHTGDEQDALRGVDLTTETSVLGRDGPSARLPLSPEAERAGREDAVRRLADRARRPVNEDAYEPEAFARGAGFRVGEIERGDLLERLWARDHTIWSEDPTEIADRLGWLDVAERMRDHAGELADWGRRVRGGGVRHVVLCGMGGSSLAPEMFHALLGGEIPLTVLDTTDPAHVAAVRDGIDVNTTLFCIASKSGTTVETRSQLELFWAASGRGDRFVAVTDPGSPLAKLASERRFARTFENPPDIGGRYSALSYFGLVPAALVGIDLDALLAGGLWMQGRHAPSVSPSRAPGTRLGAALAEAASAEDRDKLTLLLPPEIASLGAWIEQLVAESTGKDGKGLLPVVGEELGGPEVYGADRVFVAYALGDDAFPEALKALEEADHPVIRIRTPGPASVGAEIYRWEIATAVLGHLLELHPFDQPDVESAKRAAREALEAAAPGAPEAGSASGILEGVAAPSYVAIQAFLTPTDDTASRLQAVRMRLRDRHQVAATVGFGPRYLHSTGQLHKGGPPTGVFLQVTQDHPANVDVPGAGYSFARLIDAQADGDLRALREAGRPAARLTLDELERLVQT